MPVIEQIGIGGQGAQLKLTQFERRLLKRYRDESVYNKFASQQFSIPAHGGKSINIRKMESIFPAGNGGPAAAGSAPTALTEGTPPAAIQATWTELAATISQYGQWIAISDMLEVQGFDSVISETTENLSESMTQALDYVTRDALIAQGTNVQYAGAGASRGAIGSGALLNMAELREAKRTLLRANVPGLRSQGGKYGVITHPDSVYDLEAEVTVVSIWSNAGTRGMESNQLFDTMFQDLPYGFRLTTTTAAKTYSSLGLSGANVYITHVVGEDAYGTVKLSAMPAAIIRHERGSAGAADPLNQYSTIGWKAAHTALVLNQVALVRIEHVTSA